MESKEVSIQLKLSENENKIVSIYKALKGLKSKRLAIKSIIRCHKELLDKLK